MKKLLNFKMLLVAIGLLITSLTSQVWADADPSFFGSGYCTMDITYNNGSGSTTLTQNDGTYVDLGTVSAFQWNNFSFRMCKESGGNVGNLCGEAWCHYSDELSGVAASWTDESQTNVTWNYNNNSNNVQYEGTMNKNMLYQKGGGIYELRYCFWAKGSYYYNGGCGTQYWKPGGTNYYVIRYTINPSDVSSFTVTPSGHISGSGTESDPYIVPYGGTLTLTSSSPSKSNTYDTRSTAQYSLNNSTWGTGSSYTTTTISNIKSYTNASTTLYARYTIADADGNSTADDPLYGASKSKTIYYKAATWNLVGDMNSWDTHETPLVNTSGSTYSKTITLDANGEVAFKIIDNQNGKWYTYSSSSSTADLTYADNSGNSYHYNDDGSYGNTILKTAGAGSYTFTWDASYKNLTVTYPTSYTVTFGYGAHGSSVTASGSVSGDIESGDYVASGENVTFTEEHDDGYSLKGWYTTEDGNTAVSTMSSTDNVLNSIGANANVYAQYDEIMRTITVAYKCGGTSIQSNGSVSNVGIATSKSVTAPDIEGYTFSTWSSMPSNVTTASSLTGKTITITAEADATITANYTLNSHTLTWNLDGGTVVTAGTGAAVDATGTPSSSVNYGASITAPVPEKDGYTFTGWNTTPASTMPDNDLTYTAQWSEITHTVSFENDGNGSTDPDEDQTVGVVTGVDISADPVEGYEFDEWTSSDGGTFDDASAASTTFYPTANTTLTANFKLRTYNITLDDNGDYSGNGSAKVVWHGTSLTNISAPTRDDGYEVDYYALYANGNNKVASSTGELEKGLLGYLSEEGEWIHNDDETLYVIWKPRSYTITLNRQGGTDGPTSFTVTMGLADYSPETVKPTRAGYHFEGYYTEPLGEGTQIFDENGEANANVSGYTGTLAKWDNTTEDLELYAHWTPVALTTNGNGTAWGTAANWTPNCVPTSEHNVTIAHNMTVNGAAEANTVTISTGILTVASDGALEVTGSITNSNAEKLVVKPSGALIYAGSTDATVELSLNSSRWQMIAIPVSGVSVSSAFYGSSVYTYVWKYGEGWERRGYYDAVTAFEPLLITGMGSCSFSGSLVSTSLGQGGTLFYDADKTNGDVNMFGNSWTAPIEFDGITISGSADGAVHTFTGSSWPGITAGGVIPAMQGFAVVAASGGGSITIPYSAVRGVSSPNEALKAPKRTTSNLLDHITIYVSGNEWTNRICLYENEQFTDEIDMGYEALHMEGEGYAGELYAQATEKMNVLAVPDLEGTVVGFIPGQATNYTISFEGDGRGYYLNDIVTGQSTLIDKENTYIFTQSENDAARFIISKTPIHKTPTGVDAINDGVKARKQLINGILYIIRDGRLYDTTGALVK